MPASNLQKLMLAAISAVAALAALATIATVAPVGAHGELVASSPGRGETVGRASHIDLVFSTEMFDWTIDVEGPSGDPVVGEAVQKAGSLLSFEAVPLTDEGQYVVRYSGTDDDGDIVEGAYAFVLEAGAPAPAPFPDDLLVFQDDGWPIWRYLVLFVGVVIIAALAGLLAEKLRRLRAMRAQ